MLILSLLSCAGPITNDFLQEDREYLDALPQRDQHRLLGETTVATSEIEAMATSLNASLESLLAWVDAVQGLPPTERDAESRVWGPHIADETGDLYWRVTIERVEPGRFAWAFALRVGVLGDWVVFSSGDYLAGFDPSESQGGFSYDLAPLQAVGLSEESGSVSVAYDYIGEHELYAALSQDGIMGDYWYREADGLSSVWFALPANVDETSQALEDHAVAAQWTGGGAGRLESLTTGGDLGDLQVRYTECWDDTGTVLYAAYDCEVCTEPATGSIDDCALSEGLDPTDPPD
jgi:hypothetical protein